MNKNLKILQLGKYYFGDIKGGIEKVIYDIYQNINCDILCSNIALRHEKITKNKQIIYKTASFGQLLSISITPQMIFKLRRIANFYDIIHIHHPDPMATLALFLSGFKGKVILHWHSDIVKQKLALKLFSPLQKWLLIRANKIIATTPKYVLESKFLMNFKNKCISIPIGVDIILKSTNKLPNILQRNLHKKIVFSLGRLIYYKGFEYLINAAKYLNNDYLVLIGGDGILKSTLNKIIKKNKLTNKVIILGDIPYAQLYHFYNQAKVFVLPSIFKSEAFGIVQIEAMSLGTPVIATKIESSGTSWVNDDEFSGINVEIKNSKQISSAIQRICDDQKEQQEFAKRALERYNKMFTMGIMINKLNKLYQDIN